MPKRSFELVIIDVSDGFHWRLFTDRHGTPWPVSEGQAESEDGCREEARDRAEYYVRHYDAPAVREKRETFELDIKPEHKPSRRMLERPTVKLRDGAILPKPKHVRGRTNRKKIARVAAQRT